MKKRLWLLLPLCCLFIGGCIQTKIIEDLLLVQAIGFDSVNKNVMKGTLSYSKYSSPKSRNPVPEVISLEGKTTKGIESKINSEVSLPVELGQLRVVVFGKKMAKQGVKNLVGTLIRDPEVGTLVYLAVADGKAETLLARTYLGNYTIPSMYVANMFEQNNRTQSLPTTNLHVFAYHLFDPDCDAFLPIIGERRDHVVIEGLALFHKGRYVAKIDQDRMFVFKRLYENAPSGLYEVNFQSKGKKVIVDVRDIISHETYSVKHAAAIPTITINVDMKGSIVESTDALNLKNDQTITQIQNEMEKEFKQKAQEMIKRFQKLGIDPLCIGSDVRSRDRSWSPEKWKDVYPKAHIHVNVDMDITQSGAID